MVSAPERDSQLARFEAATASPMVGVSLAVIPVYVAQALASDAGSWATRPLDIVRLLIQITMGLDLAIRTYLSPRRGAYLATHKLDLLAIAVPPVRAARELVAVRSILARPGVTRFSIFSGTVIVGCALVVYAAEHDRSGASIQSLGDAFWWATVTATTVGYGDEVPITEQGRVMAVILMLLGIALFAVLTAHIAAYFVDDSGRATSRDDLLDRLDRLETSLAAIDVRLRRLSLVDDLRSDAPPPAEEVR